MTTKIELVAICGNKNDFMKMAERVADLFFEKKHYSAKTSGVSTYDQIGFLFDYKTSKPNRLADKLF